MQGMKYVKILVEEIHSTTAATIGEDGRPQTRAIDMMLYDENGVYFLTAKGKAFYQQLMEQQYLALSGTKDKKAVSLRGKIKNIGSEKLDEIFEKNTDMQQIYPGDTRDALEVFCLYEAQGEYFDISDPSHIVRETIIIGAGAGASAAAGLKYSRKRFTDNFAEFIQKYGAMYMSDMYAAGFYPFPTQEAKWGYWSKHSMMNRFEPPALPLYEQLYKIVEKKDYFVLTTNVDHQFQKAGFAEERIFATQGDYGEIQCEKGCHPKVYQAEKIFRQMDQARKDCVIPTYMVPKCPVCGGNMAMHLRCDNYFVEDEDWHEAVDRYADFLDHLSGKKVVLLELGVGFNTPVIIRLPFEKMAKENKKATLIRLNLDEAVVPESLGNRAIGINADMEKSVKELYDRLG